MHHGRLYRFTCEACDGEYIAVGAKNDDDALAAARANGWLVEETERGYCPNCKWDGEDA